MTRKEQAERKAAMIADYLGGMRGRDVAAKYGKTYGSLMVSFHHWGVKLPEDDRHARTRSYWEEYRCAKV